MSGQKATRVVRHAEEQQARHHALNAGRLARYAADRFDEGHISEAMELIRRAGVLADLDTDPEPPIAPAAPRPRRPPMPSPDYATLYVALAPAEEARIRAFVTSATEPLKAELDRLRSLVAAWREDAQRLALSLESHRQEINVTAWRRPVDIEQGTWDDGSTALHSHRAIEETT
jgi:hypothetical protein